MKLSALALLASAAPFISATLNFLSASVDINVQISGLADSITQIKLIATQKGHTQIASKCDEAHGHLQVAQGSLSIITNIFKLVPWNARGSVHANTVRSRMSSCGSSLNWIYAQPEIRKFPQYKAPVSRCQSSYGTAQKGCGQIWTWPAPRGYTPPSNSYTPPSSGYAPKPSQAHHRNNGYTRRAPTTNALECFHYETACPMSYGSTEKECLDVQNEVASCGGCVTESKGENCLIIPGADGVGCLKGSCVVLSVQDGYVLHTDGRPQKR